MIFKLIYTIHSADITTNAWIIRLLEMI